MGLRRQFRDHLKRIGDAQQNIRRVCPRQKPVIPTTAIAETRPRSRKRQPRHNPNLGDRPLNPQWKSGKVKEWKSKTIPPFHLSTFPPTTESLGDRPFKRVTVREAYRRWARWDPWTEWDQDRFDLDMATKIEPALKSEGAVFLMDYPPQAASLARLRGDVAERWEFYIDGLELANCFTELCDPAEQRQRFEVARQERRQLGESDYPMDEEFLLSLGSIGSAAGVALGVDRLVMTLLGAPSIESVRCGL